MYRLLRLILAETTSLQLFPTNFMTAPGRIQLTPTCSLQLCGLLSNFWAAILVDGGIR